MVLPCVYRLRCDRGVTKDYEFPGLSDLELGWLVGIIDGEGYITHRLNGRTKHHPQINVASTCLELLETLHQLVNIGNICRRRAPLNPKHSQAWQWSTSRGAAVYGLCDVMKDLLIVKRAKARSILEAFSEQIEVLD